MTQGNVNAPLEERIQRLEDRLEIEDVIVAGALFIDVDDYSRAEAAYADDAIIDIGDAMGEDATFMTKQEHWRRLHGMLKAMYINWHQITNFHIEVRGDTAIAISEVRAIHQVDQGDGVIAHFGAIYYHTLARTPLGWKIKRQKATLRYMEGDHAVLTRAKAKVASGQVKTEGDRAYRRPDGVKT